MRISVDDSNVRARVGTRGDRTRLVIEYPTEPYYRDLVWDALAKILCCAPRQQVANREATAK